MPSIHKITESIASVNGLPLECIGKWGVYWRGAFAFVVSTKAEARRKREELHRYWLNT